MIEVSNLTKRYGRHTAVDSVSFTVQKGEILGFLGPNGAGKTTTMRILTCYLPPTEGTARVAGFEHRCLDTILGGYVLRRAQKDSLSDSAETGQDKVLLWLPRRHPAQCDLEGADRIVAPGYNWRSVSRTRRERVEYWVHLTVIASLSSDLKLAITSLPQLIAVTSLAAPRAIRLPQRAGQIHAHTACGSVVR